MKMSSIRKEIAQVHRGECLERPHAERQPCRAVDLVGRVRRSVSVAKGAKLVARGKTPEAIAGLTIAEAGMGELENIVLDEKGTVDLVLANPRVPAAIETSLDQVATGANITKWAVRVNGRPKTAKLGLAADGTLTYHPDGLMLLVR